MAKDLPPVWGKVTRTILLLVGAAFLLVVLGSAIALGVDDPVQLESQPVVLQQETITHTQYLPLTARDYPPPLPVFGVVMITPIHEGYGLTQAVSAGVHWVDYGAVGWPSVEPVRTNPPTYHWEVVDEQSLIAAAQNDLTVIAKVHHTPVWARAIPSHNCSRIRRESFDEFAQFLSALVSRYKDPPYNIHHWELDSEVDIDPSLVAPDSPIGFWCWGDRNDYYYGGGYFAEMLRWAYPAIKSADPQAQVVIGGLLLDCDPRNPPPGKNCQSSRFLEGVLRGGGGPYFDVVSFHAYSYYAGVMGRMSNSNWTGGDGTVQTTAIPEKTLFLQQVLDSYGYGQKGLMNLESALMCSTASYGCSNTQAMYVPRAYAEALALGIVAQAWYQMKDPDWRHTGLLNDDLSPKLAYFAYQAAAGFLSDVKYVGPVTAYPSNPKVRGYTFRKLDRSAYIDVVWTTDGTVEIVILPPGAAGYDRYGTPTAGPPYSWGDWIQASYEPLYVRRPLSP